MVSQEEAGERTEHLCDDWGGGPRVLQYFNEIFDCNGDDAELLPTDKGRAQCEACGRTDTLRPIDSLEDVQKVPHIQHIHRQLIGHV